MKSSEIRDRSDEELAELASQLRDQMVKLRVAHATQRSRNTSTFGRLRKDIARVETIIAERRLGIAPQGVVGVSTDSEGEG